MNSAPLASTARASLSLPPGCWRAAALGRWTGLLGAFLVLSFLSPPARAQTPKPAVFTTLHSFTGTLRNANPEGAEPVVGLLLGLDGNFYGAAESGGANGNGTVFRCTPDGTVSVVHSFSAFNADGSANADGANPEAALIQDAGGNLYGTTVLGGANSRGTAFEVTLAGGFTDLHDFGAGANQAGGEFPSSLLLTPDGLLVGTANGGGDSSGDGTFFFLDGTAFGPVLSFGGSPGIRLIGSLAFSNPPGAQFPTLYGACEGGGNGSGVIFRLPGAAPGGSLLATYTFSALGANSQNADGNQPSGGVILGSDGNLYGTTVIGGTGGDGTVWQIVVDPDSGVAGLTVLHAFVGSDGSESFAPLVEGSDGSFYGTTSAGGAAGTGVVFRVTTGKVYTVLHSFSITTRNANSDGAQPEGGLVEVRPGSFVGTAFKGGANGVGTIFEVDVPPVITSAATATGNVGSAFSYQITAADSPGSLSVSGLGDGLTVDVTTGLISGTPTAAGTLKLTLNATNNAGTGSQALTVTITALPVITSPDAASAVQGQAFSYQITGTNNPTSYAATGLPPGLTLDAAAGVISGIPTADGSFPVTLSATSTGGIGTGTGTGTLALTIAPAPVTLTATTPEVVLGSGDSAVFTLALPLALDHDIVVTYSIQGTAANGTDYQLLAGMKKIKAGKTAKPIKIIPMGDLDGESKKTVVLTLIPGDGYTVGTTGKVKVKILGQ